MSGPTASNKPLLSKGSLCILVIIGFALYLILQAYIGTDHRSFPPGLSDGHGGHFPAIGEKAKLIEDTAKIYLFKDQSGANGDGWNPDTLDSYRLMEAGKIDKRAYDEVVQRSLAEYFEKLRLDDRLCVLPNGTSARVLAYYRGLALSAPLDPESALHEDEDRAKVRVLDGEYRGQEGFISVFHIRNP